MAVYRCTLPDPHTAAWSTHVSEKANEDWLVGRRELDGEREWLPSGKPLDVWYVLRKERSGWQRKFSSK